MLETIVLILPQSLFFIICIYFLNFRQKIQITKTLKYMYFALKIFVVVVRNRLFVEGKLLN